MSLLILPYARYLDATQQTETGERLVRTIIILIELTSIHSFKLATVALKAFLAITRSKRNKKPFEEAPIKY